MEEVKQLLNQKKWLVINLLTKTITAKHRKSSKDFMLLFEFVIYISIESYTKTDFIYKI